MGIGLTDNVEPLGSFPVAYLEHIGQIKFDGTTAPTVDDDADAGYVVGSIWIDVTAAKSYICLDNTNEAAVWHQIDLSGGGMEQHANEFHTPDMALASELTTHTTDEDAHHAHVTLGGGSAAELTLDGQELTLAAVLTPDEHTAIGDDAPHHAKYLDSEAIAAVEGEATLDLAGDVTIAAGKSLAVGAILEITADAGVAVEGVQHLDSFVELSLISDPDAPGSGVRLYAKEVALQPWLYIRRAGFEPETVATTDMVVSTVENELTLDLLGNVTIEHSRSLSVATILEMVTDAGVSIEGVRALDSFLELSEIAKPDNPAENKLRLYVKDKAGVSTLYYLQDDGTEVEVGAGNGGNGATDHIIDADADTEVHTEKTADVDQIQMKVAGTKRLVLQNASPYLGITAGGGTALQLQPNGISSGNIIGLEFSPSGCSLSNNCSAIGVYAIAAVPQVAESASGYLKGLFFVAGVVNPADTTLTELTGVEVKPWVASVSGEITTVRGLRSSYHGSCSGAGSIETSVGLDLEDFGRFSQIVDAYGIRVANLTSNSGVKRLIELGPPYFRVEGGTGPAGVNSMVIIDFGGTLYRLTRNAVTGAVETAAI